MKNKIINLWGVLVKAYFQWYEKDPFRESAIIAYYSIFSLPGLMVVLFTIASFFMSGAVVSNTVHEEIKRSLGKNTADAIDQMMVQTGADSQSILATILGLITILVGATGVFVQFQKSLNIIWEVKADQSKSGIWTFLKARLFSFGLIVSIAFLLLISLVVASVITMMSGWMESHWPKFVLFLFQAFNLIFSGAIIMLLFALMFKVLPDVKIRWRSVWPGAILTSLLFSIGKSAMGFYFGMADPASGYGAAGSIVLILLWVSYSSMIVFFGAEFTKAYSEKAQGKIVPSELAVKSVGRTR